MIDIILGVSFFIGVFVLSCYLIEQHLMRKAAKKAALVSKKWHYTLEFFRKDGSIYCGFHHTDHRTFSKIYFWFLLRDSPKYNMVVKKGMTTILRSEIARVQYRKEWK